MSASAATPPRIPQTASPKGMGAGRPKSPQRASQPRQCAAASDRMTRTRRRPDLPSGEVALLCTILREVSRLRGALCRGRPLAFDAGSPSDADEAIALCHACPALSECRQWADGQPPGALVGVVGGRVQA